MELEKTLEELRKNLKKRKFNQTIDLIVNLKNIDVRKESVNAVISLPHKIKDKKVCGFLTKKSDLVTTVLQTDFQKYKDKKALKQLVKNHDFFIASAPLMPKVATTFGKVLGPAGKMPSPQLGILPQENDSAIKETLNKISKSLKIRTKEPSIKISIGKESMDNKDIIENIKTAHKAILNALPRKKENVKNTLLKFTMSKPLKIEIK